ncbi:GNAT family N-acetyltransferase [Fructilactobacillus fructivorans]|uniref:GNAT family N-acetyltransferase n=1 Tax=Fructilactobacillus fructivorans TaxID=1614 RepID=A0A0C1Q463_9LACO|nr:GNAT family N-acetyltransferase [Fructilactobacillus fructivorans]KID42683.1 Histone acetyltransferase HPA2 and related acetyltransferase [Fructilactobacillus fructivorans]KRK56938.1 GCN5-like N-acetyltransferase [Fructilactobacillus fructivorans]KRN41198.1 GCN5-like N-acetyltransferase [Fructilactobacillus fructivorans]MCT0151918.1 GNAT family N-acetyltransferase [Fructilactobacillus fructivorans]MCT2868083.1 GNAT family N-acetyltransferase [Fructilactobacillus fructivorans]
MSTIYVRKATEADLDDIYTIIKNAKKFLGEQGIDQWQSDYPSEDDLARDVKFGISYVLDVDGQVAGTATLHLGIDPDYLHLEGGEWANGDQGHYSAIHRIAVSNDYRGQGLASKFISGLFTISSLRGFKDVRIDTHPDNKGMQHVILSNGFTKRGTIYANGKRNHGTERFAYQIELK